MKELNPREHELVALGAAVASNCIPCIEYHIPEALKAGLTEAQILEAVRLADRVKQVPARKVLDAAERLLGVSQSPDQGVQGACATSSTTINGCCG